MIFRILTLLSLLVTPAAFAGDGSYAVSNISPALLKGANVVKRMEEKRFEVFDADKTVFNYKYALTILNDNGDEHARLVEYYDKMRKVDWIEGNLYDAGGKLLKKLKNKDIQDLSSVSDNNLIDDSRNKLHNFYHKVYPYTVEYEVQISYNNSFHFPGWVTQEGEHLAVEKSSYTFVCPVAYQFRYRALNYKGEPVQTSEKGKKSFTWQVASLPAVHKETSSPRWHELTTMLKIAPTNFEVEGYKGNMTTWKEFGRFIYALNKGKDVLPEEVKQKVHQLIKGTNDEKEKIRILYEFLQQNTRYISIQLGIGGWQPFAADYVARKGYGDCKALSNYMYSLLKEANIRSLYTIIKAGRGEHFIMEDFPSNEFNHAVLCVPLKKDTMWLECTSQTNPAGYMGEFTGNRKALVIDENGGTLVSTPRYGLEENLQVRSIKGKLDEDGSLLIKVDTRYHSLQQDGLHGFINALSKEKVKEYLQEGLDLATYDIHNFKYTEQKNRYPEIEEALEIYVSNYATTSGKRLFLTPNILNRSQAKMSIDTARKYDLCFDYAYKDVDSIEIEVVAGYAIESIAQPVSIKTRFGTYSSSVKLDGNKVRYVRIREQFAGRFPPADYAALSKYYADIFKADRARIVLVKQDK
jgi:hypothetical protein